MGNTDQFEKIATTYDTPERIQIAEVSANVIREYLRDTKDKRAIDFGCGTGLVGMKLLGDFGSMLFLDASLNMIAQVRRKIAAGNMQNADTLCFDLETDALVGLHSDYILWLCSISGIYPRFWPDCTRSSTRTVIC